MSSFYSNLLSPESKYAWNKIVSKQMESNLFVNLQGVSLEGPRGMSRKSFNDCIMFHLPSMQQSKKSTMSPMYLRSPSAPTHVSLYIV